MVDISPTIFTVIWGMVYCCFTHIAHKRARALLRLNIDGIDLLVQILKKQVTAWQSDRPGPSGPSGTQ